MRIATTRVAWHLRAILPSTAAFTHTRRDHQPNLTMPGNNSSIGVIGAFCAVRVRPRPASINGTFVAAMFTVAAVILTTAHHGTAHANRARSAIGRSVIESTLRHF